MFIGCSKQTFEYLFKSSILLKNINTLDNVQTKLTNF